MEPKKYNQVFSVPFEYEVCFTRDLFHPQNQTLREAVLRREPDKQHRVVVFVDDGVLRKSPSMVKRMEAYCDSHRDAIDLVLPPVSVPGGENVKIDLTHVESMQQLVYEQQIDRHSYIIGIGGGAVLDAVGWVAATAHRGIRHIRIPTTVLAQNDSGVGVKNGVNFFGVKNYLGCFAPPWAVLNDIEFVELLDRRDQIAGIAEAVKVALIRDGQFFQWLEANSEALSRCELNEMEWMIRRCAELHMNQIARGGDPFESGSARPLDYGHWSAHKIESMTDYEIRHGEAVAIGLALDTRYSVLSGLLEPGSDERVCELLEALGFELWHPALSEETPNQTRMVLQGLSDFKEHLGGELTITLLKEIGVGLEVHEMDEQLVLEAIEWLQQRSQTPVVDD